MLVARCRECGDVHDLAARERAAVTTTCPACGSRPYTTDIIDCPEDADALQTTLEAVDGIGTTIADRLVERYCDAAVVRQTSVNGLTSISGVSETRAERISEAV